MHMYEAEAPTCNLRWNTYNARTAPRLQQQWDCRRGDVSWTEWRDVPVTEEAPGIKAPTSQHTMD